MSTNNKINASKDSFHQHYKKCADSYDKLRDERSVVTKRNAADQINFVLKHFENIDEIIEIGCGTGKFTIPLAKAGKKVIAIDYAEEMLNIVREKATKEGVIGNIDLRHGDIENLNIASNDTHGVLSIAVTRHFKDNTKAISELARILDTSGVLIIDYLSSLFFKPYDIIKKYILRQHPEKGPEWFVNYYRNYHSMRKTLQTFDLEIMNKQGFVLFPTAITEMLHLNLPVKYIEHKFGLGGVVFVVARKRNVCT